MDYELGCYLPAEDWAWLNRTGVFRDPALRKYVSPFPPAALMQNVSGLVKEEDFASHGADIFEALSAASPRPLAEYQHLLDFGCGCGRLARMFKGHPHQVSGCDIDRRHVEWARQNLDYMKVSVSSVKPPLPSQRDDARPVPRRSAPDLPARRIALSDGAWATGPGPRC